MTGNRHRHDPAWEQALDWLLRLRASPDDGNLRAAHEAWLAESAAHMRAYAKAEKVWRLTGDVAPVETRIGRREIETQPLRRAPLRGSRNWRLRRAVGLAAAAIAACLAFLFLLSDLEVRLRADYVTGVGERRLVTLADGSSVYLDADSAISLDGAPPARAVTLLAGQAYFEVAPDSGHPFTVTAGEVTVTVVGTAFDVQVAEGSAAVAVQRGRVEVEVSRDGPRMAASLGAGDSLTVDRTSGAMVLGAVDTRHVASWRTGRLVVDGATVAQVVEQLRRYHYGAILLEDDRLAERRVTGVFDLYDPIGALRAVVEPHAGEVTELAPYLLLVTAR